MTFSTFIVALVLSGLYHIVEPRLWLLVPLVALLELRRLAPSSRLMFLVVGFSIMALYTSLGLIGLEAYLNATLSGAIIIVSVWVLSYQGKIDVKHLTVLIISMTIVSALMKVIFLIDVPADISAFSTQERFTYLYLGKDLFFLNSNDLGFLLFALVLTGIEGRGVRSEFSLTFLILLALILLTRSRSATVLVMLAFCWYSLRPMYRHGNFTGFVRASIVIFTITSSLSLALIMTDLSWGIADDFSASERLRLVMGGLDVVNREPLSPFNYLEYYSLFGNSTHNMFVELWLIGGVTSLVIYVFFLFLAINDLRFSIALFIISFLTNNIFSSPVYLALAPDLRRG